MSVARQQALAILALLGAVSAVLLINPVGFIGGTRDDGQYLEAARCLVQHGLCLPLNHWQGRWPVFAPVAFLIHFFGESRAIVQLWPLACGVTALLLFARVGQRLFDLRTGLIAGLLLAITPAFTFQLLRPNAETIELALILAAIVCILAWRDRPTGKGAFAAGLFFGLAFQVRETSIVAALIAAGTIYALGLRPRLAHLACSVSAFALPLAIEFAVYQISAGDFLFRRRLSLLHAQIPSSELPISVDHTRSPILNPDYIANWRRDMGIHVHWLIDGPLNLLFNAKSGFSLLLAPLLLIAGRKWIDHATRRAAWWSMALAAIHVAIITYAFAIDPKPRIMLVPIALSSTALALILSNLLRHGHKALAITLGVGVALSGASITASSVRMAWADRQAKVWSAQYPRGIETDQLTRLTLTLNADVRAMPDLEAERPYVMIMRNLSCREWVKRSRLNPTALSIAGEKRLSILPEAVGQKTTICLYRYNYPVSGTQMKAALDRGSAAQAYLQFGGSL